MKTTEDYFINLNDKDLSKAYFELESLRNTGVLGDGIVRQISRQMHDDLGIDMTHTLTITEKSFYYEMARRYIVQSSK